MIRIVFDDGSSSEQPGKGENDLSAAVQSAISATQKDIDRIVQIWYPDQNYLDEVTGEYSMTHISGSALHFYLDRFDDNHEGQDEPR